MPKQPELKYFRITSLGDTCYEYAPSRQSILEDLQRAGVYDKDTIVEEVTEEQAQSERSGVAVTTAVPDMPPPENEVSKIFTLPGGQKVKDENGTLYGLEWTECTKGMILKRIGCEDIEFPKETTTLKILDWVELKPEGKEEDAS